MKETDLFQPVKALFEGQGYTVYSEVQCGPGRADIVAVHGPELVVVELKTSLGLEVMEQAAHWKGYANRIYVGVPEPKRGQINGYARRLLRMQGIGLITVTFPDPKWGALVKDIAPEAQMDNRAPAALDRKVYPYLRNALTEEHKAGPPGGSAGGGYVTDYKLTMKRVRDFLRWKTLKGEWVTVGEMLERVQTHYATPKSSLAKALVSFEASWCETKKENGKLWFRYKR